MNDKIIDALKAQSSGLPRYRRPNAAPVASMGVGSRQVVKNSDIIYQNLRRDIVAMTLVPGTPISEKGIAREYGVSRTPVREAVLRLSDERLVEVLAKSGTYVARIPLSLLPEAIVVRNALEAVTVRKAAEIASKSQILGLQALVQHQQEVIETDDQEEFHTADEEFHAAIAAAAGYRGIWEVIQQVKVHVDRYRRLTLPQPGRMDLIVEEHDSIVQAIANNDPERAAKNMEYHLDKLQLDIAVFRDMWPDYFIHDITLKN